MQLDWCNEMYAFQAVSVDNGDGNRVWASDHLPTRRILNSGEVKKLVENWYEHPLLADRISKEGILRFKTETDAFLEKLGYCRDESQNGYISKQPNDQRIALFFHCGAGSLILSHVLGIPYPQFELHFTMDHSGVTIIEFREVDSLVIPQVLTYSNDSHLYREGIPTKYQNRIYC